MADSVLLCITALFWLSVFAYTPAHIDYLSRRFSYYVFDDESVDLGLLLREWMKDKAGVVWGGAKRLIGSGASGKAEL